MTVIIIRVNQQRKEARLERVQEHNLRVIAIQESWSDVVGKIQASLPLIWSRWSSHDAATAKSQSRIPQNSTLALGESAAQSKSTCSWKPS